MASPAGRGAQVILTGTQQSAARGVVGPEITVNLETKRVLEFTGTVADGTTLDGSTRTGLPAVDAGVVALGTPTLSATTLVEQSLPGQPIGVLVGLTAGSRRHLAANAGGRVALSGGGDRLVVGATASVAADGALKVVLRETMGAQTRDTILIVTVAAYDSATAALLAAFTGAPAAYVAGAYDRLIRGMKAAGIWTALDVFWLASHDDQASRVNWKLPGTYTGTKTGTLDFQAFKGFKSDGTTGYISTGWNPATNASAFTVNSASLGWLVYPDFTAGIPASIADNNFDIGNGGNMRGIARSGATISGRLNSTNTGAPLAVTTSIGLAVMVRRDAATLAASKAGGATTSIANAATGIGSGTLLLCGNIGSTFSVRRIGCAFAGRALTDAEIAAFSGLLDQYFREVNTWVTEDTRGPPVYSTSAANYGTMSSQQIPDVAVIGSRRFRVNYGIHGAAAGTNGETAPCYVRLSYSDDGGATYNFGCAWVPNIGTEAVIDPHVEAQADGSLLVAMPYRGSGGKRSIWAYVLTNPSAAPASWAFTAPAFWGFGFVGAAYPDGPDLMTSLNETYSGTVGNYLDTFARIRACNGVPVATPIARLPNSGTDASNDYSERSFARVPAGLIGLFRTNTTSLWSTTSADDGVTWTAAKPWTVVPNPSARVALAASPTGNIYMAGNNSTTAREKMTLWLMAPDMSAAVQSIQLDSRTAASSSYPGIAFSGTGTATVVCVDHDYGRGVQDPPNYPNELLAHVVSEAGMLTGAPTKTTNTVTS